MGFWSNIFKKGEDPQSEIFDDVLGNLVWNEDRESWDGVRNGIRFGVSYDYASKPKQEVLIYARQIVPNDNWYIETLEQAKKIALQEYPEKLQNEINSLTIKSLSFFDHERLHIQFFESDDEPWWFAEAINGTVEFVGFDT